MAKKRPTKKPAYHHGDLRRALIDAAGGLLDVRGLEAVTLREAARRAGVTEGAPYKHFRDLDDLLVALAREGFAMLAADLEVAGDVRLKWREFARQFPGRYQIMFVPRSEEGRALLREQLDRLGHEGQLSGVPLAQLHGEAMLEISGLDPETY